MIHPRAESNSLLKQAVRRHKVMSREGMLEKLFERLFRGEASRTRALGGSGLGLALCKSLVEAHGGQITAHMSPLGGLQIHIHLPLAGTLETDT